MEKWRPILQAEAEEANKMTLVDYANAFTSFALPLAVGFTLPLIRRLGEGNVIGDVIFPKIDQAGDLLKGGVKKAIELPICLEAEGLLRAARQCRLVDGVGRGRGPNHSRRALKGAPTRRRQLRELGSGG